MYRTPAYNSGKVLDEKLIFNKWWPNNSERRGYNRILFSTVVSRARPHPLVCESLSRETNTIELSVSVVFQSRCCISPMAEHLTTKLSILRLFGMRLAPLTNLRLWHG